MAGLARSTFFSHQARLAAPAPKAELKAAITALFWANYERYGHRRIHASLVQAGWCVAKKTVLALMRQLGLVCQVRRRKRHTAYRGRVGTVAPNVLNRDFTATAPNEKWVTDVTEFAVEDDTLYLSPIMDLFDRQVIAYALGPSPTLAFTQTAFQTALATVGPGETPLVHSDQGFQYQHASWQQLLAEVGGTPSMSRKGNCLDNAVIESFFGHLKAELFCSATFGTIDALTKALHEYIYWFNHHRAHSTLGGLSPVQFRAKRLHAA